MRKKYSFYKVSATGNDFIVIDNRTRRITKPSSFALTYCQRQKGVGADGLILLEKSRKADLKMRIINSDGSEAEMCGNGIRAAAWVAHHKLDFNRRITFNTLAGNVETTVTQNVIKAQLYEPKGFRDYAPLEVKDGIFYFYFINTGVPHVVIFEDDLKAFPVERIGREIRYHPHFQPQGTNVNFVQVKNKNAIYVRTYERGVEAETLACGTGSTASAIIAALIGKGKPPITVHTQSKETLTIHFDVLLYHVSNIFLEGSAQCVFEGVIAD